MNIEPGLLSSNLTCPDETQPSNWNTQQTKQLRYQASIHILKMVYTILFLELISFLPVMGSKQQRNKINFELSKTEQ